jgi:hypothetical protein
VKTYGRAGQATDDMRCFACWITKATDAHSECVIRVAFVGNSGYTNAPHFYTVRTLHVLLMFYRIRTAAL